MKPCATWLALALTLALPSAAQAHKFWLLPSQTVLASGHANWITVDGAVSNDLFYFNHHALGLDHLVITAPDGSSVEPSHVNVGKWRSSFDVRLDQDGTYKLASASHGLMARYKLGGKFHRWRGTPEELSKIPAAATELKVVEHSSRVETFVTVGKPSREVLKTTGHGLELAAVTHPNDLYAGESGTFRLLVDGKPAQGLEVTIIRGGTRYRSNPEALHVTTDEKGTFRVTWPQPGMYWLGASVKDDHSAYKQAAARSMSYVATLEVLPL